MALQSKLIITVILLLLLQSCTSPDRTDHRILVVYDVTGSTNGSLPTATKVMDDIIRLIDPKVHPHDGYHLSITRIDDVSGAQLQHVEIKADETNMASGNPKKRAREISKFIADATIKVENLLQDADLDKPVSKIYSKLCSSMDNLYRQDAKHYVLVYSDMMENSNLSSFYKAGVIATASQDPGAYAQQHLAQQCDIRDLSSYMVALYPYRTAQNDELINLAERFWAGLLQAKGAVVKVNN